MTRHTVRLGQQHHFGWLIRKAFFLRDHYAMPVLGQSRPLSKLSAGPLSHLCHASNVDKVRQSLADA